jgi:hypothetical protein
MRAKSLLIVEEQLQDRLLEVGSMRSQCCLWRLLHLKLVIPIIQARHLIMEQEYQESL